jgi:hypothetical protein
MEQREYQKKLVRTEDGENIYLDLRTFGNQEAEAIDFCLQEMLSALSYRMKSEKKAKRVVVICEPTAKIPPSADTVVRQINQLGQAVEIRPQHRETSE